MGQVNINANILGSVVTSGLLNPPFYDDLDTWHKGISGVDFVEKINNLPAKFLPRIADLNGTDDNFQLNSNITIDYTKNTTIYFKYKLNSLTACAILGQALGTTNYIVVNTANNGSIYIESNTNDDIAQTTTGIVNDLNWHEVEVNINNGIVTVYVDSVSVTMVDNTISDNIIFNLIGVRGVSNYFNGLISCFSVKNNTSNTYDYIVYPKGMGDYEYDVSGNNNHGTWSGTGTRYDYDENGSTYPNTKGYSLWQKAANPDIQVPFDVDGNALSLTAGVDIPTGYTKTRDVVAGGSRWNMADALVDFANTGENLDVIINGGFDTDTNWAKSTGWTISGGKANFNGAATGLALSQSSISVDPLSMYEIQYDFDDLGNLGAGLYFRFLSDGLFSTLQQGIGTQKIYLLTGANPVTFYIEARANFAFTLDNVSCKKVDIKLDIFNRSNTTIQNATSRASLFYDAANPYRYQVNEIADPRIYETFFEAAYQYRIFSKIVLATNDDLIRYDEELNYGTQKTTEEVLKINKYLKNYLMTIPEELPAQL
jgi:hypothetical protein